MTETGRNGAAWARLPGLSPESPTILLFHGVCPEEDYGVRNYTGKHLPAASFRAILEALLLEGRPVTMDDIASWISGHVTLPPNSFCITFDDGFRNNLTVAAPILRDLEVPATFYVTTDFIEHNAPSWADLIEAAVATTDVKFVSLPAPLSTAAPLVTTADRIAFMTEIRRIVKGDPTIDPLVFADQLMDAILGQASRPKLLPILDDKLSWEDVRELSNDPLFCIGSHGRTHRVLGYLSTAGQWEELSVSTQLLAEQDSLWCRHFSYPEGFSDSFTDETKSYLRRLGFETAVTTVQGTNHRGQDPMELHRWLVS